ncbi:YwqG family protein [Solibacillus sp. FSL K6-1523]|uniref:YwqG family protein n=1 Tax=Solibacillus sp. FSL K6-1523 TaxID=2921471 RepID=UPI0030F872E6
MNSNKFLNIIEQSDIGMHKEYLHQALRPAIDLLKYNEAELQLGCSRFGGEPDLPVGSDWPTYGMNPYRFLGQINFAEIPPNEGNLPTKGLLSLFVADDYPNYDCYLEVFEEGYIHGIYTPELTNLETLISPNPSIGNAIAIKFSSTIDIPHDEYQLKDWPFTDNQNDIYTEIRDSLHKSSAYLLGYPSHYTLAYDPTPGEEWCSLLTIDSDDDLEWGWNDGNKLMVFIELDRLKNLDFSRLMSDAG